MTPKFHPSAPAAGRESARADGARMIGGRYRVLEQLGRGGMAIVYRASDPGSGRELALKQLSVTGPAARVEQATALFEREFRVLAQIAHPHVIAVYDYGVDSAGPFYTMELLDGGDLKALAPLPPARACTLMLEVCSSLALLHSRRLVHRDVSPRNVRCTREGHAKLIDFGAMAPMGLCTSTVGTPAFIAPEVVHHAGLDARTDLFSLGATLYYLLTGRPPFAARQFADLREAYRRELVPPSQLAPGIPPALDALCSALLRIDPGQRPRSVFEVMHKLEVISGVPHSEPLGVSQAYLVTPLLSGRDAQLRGFRQRMRHALHGAGGALLFQSTPGLGRSRMLDACALEAKTLGATVLRAGAGDGRPLSAAAELGAQLELELPESAVAARERAELAGALERAFARICETHALLITVDDVHRLDDASVAWLASIALAAPALRLLLAVSVEPVERPSPALAVLVRHCSTVELPPLARSETEALLGSVFGAVPHVSLLAERLHDVALGNPQQTLLLAQHLVDTSLVRYRDGQWTLPSELQPSDLPASAGEALRARIAALPPLARNLAQAQALLGARALRRDDYAALAPDATPAAIDAALLELLRAEIVRSEGEQFALGQRATADALGELLGEAEKRERHLALYELHVRRGETHPYFLAPQLLAAGRSVEALDLLAANSELLDQQGIAKIEGLDPLRVAASLEHALELSIALGRPEREQHELRRRLCSFAVVCDDALYLRHAPVWLARLTLDAGLDDYRALDPALPASERLQRALSAAAARHAATPETARVYRVDEAIKKLVVYLISGVVISTRTRDFRLTKTLHELLEPFAPLSPTLHAMWQNMLSNYTAFVLGRRLEAARRVRTVYDFLSSRNEGEVPYIASLRSAIAQMLGVTESNLGRPAAFEWAEVLDRDPQQSVRAMEIRRIASAMRGDAEGAETYRRQGELLAVRASVRQMFEKVWVIELEMAVLAWDLANIKRVIDGVAPLARKYRGWQPTLHAAEGYFQLLRGELEPALAAFEQSIAENHPEQSDPPPEIPVWEQAIAGSITALSELGRSDEAIALGERSLAVGNPSETEIGWHPIARALALAEAEAGELTRAAARVDALIERERREGVVGLRLAASYEARAQIAVQARDVDAARSFTALAVRERGGPAAAASTRIVRLIAEARDLGLEIAVEATDFELSVLGNQLSLAPEASPPAAEGDLLAGCATAEARAARALELLRGLASAPSGHLYLAGDSGELFLAATSNAPPPSAWAVRFARGFFAQQLDDQQLTGGLTGATHMLSLPGVAAFVDEAGAEHHVLVLSCKRQAAIVFAGLAVVAATAGGRVDPRAVVQASALASALLRAGDTRGVTAEPD